MNRHEIHFERRLDHPIERVWAALTRPEEIEAWLARAEIEPREGGHVTLEWLNTGDAEVIARGTVRACDPPRLLVLDTDVQGTITWELTAQGDATDLALTVVLAMPDEHVIENRSGWHVHLDFLDDWLNDGARVDWPNWPRHRWEAIRERYAASMRPIS